MYVFIYRKLHISCVMCISLSFNIGGSEIEPKFRDFLKNSALLIIVICFFRIRGWFLFCKNDLMTQINAFNVCCGDKRLGLQAGFRVRAF